MIQKHSIRDDALAKLWRETDWKSVKTRVDSLRLRITIASKDGDFDEAKQLVDELLRSMDAKMLAVREVTSRDATKEPGLGEPWETDSDKMRAVLILDIDKYEGEPLQSYYAFEPRTKKMRWFTIPTFYDRAMHELMNMASVSYTEPLLDKRMFSARDGRSIADAVTELQYLLTGSDSPEWIVKFDVRAFYDSISHQWLIDNYPIFPEKIAAIFDSERIEKETGEILPWDSGVLTGDRLSPSMSRWVLNGIEELFRDSEDPMDGIALAWVDDIIVTARTKEKAERMIPVMERFLEERGLKLNTEKSGIVNIRDGLDWLGFNLKKVGEGIVLQPSEESVEDYISGVKRIISDAKTLPQMVKSVNHKYRGFKSQFRITDFSKTVERIDYAVVKAALEAVQRFGYSDSEGIQSRFIGEDDKGRFFRLDDERYIKRMSEIRRVPHERLCLTALPIVNEHYFTERSERQKEKKISSLYSDVMDAQNGICPFCKLPIRYFEDRELVNECGLKRYFHTFCLKEMSITGQSVEIESETVMKEKKSETSEEIDTISKEEIQSVVKLDDFICADEGIKPDVKQLTVENTESDEDNDFDESLLPKVWGTDIDSLLNYLDRTRYSNTFIHISKINYYSGFSLPKEALTTDSWWYNVGNNSVNKKLAKIGWYVLRADTESDLVWFSKGKMTWKMTEADQAYILRNSGPNRERYVRERDERVEKSTLKSLTEYLRNLDMDQVCLTYPDVERIAGHKLPEGSKKHQWWKTRRPNHPLTAIEDADWSKVDFVEGSYITVARVQRIPNLRCKNVPFGELESKRYLTDAMNVRFPL